MDHLFSVSDCKYACTLTGLHEKEHFIVPDSQRIVILKLPKLLYTDREIVLKLKRI